MKRMRHDLKLLVHPKSYAVGCGSGKPPCLGGTVLPVVEPEMTPVQSSLTPVPIVSSGSENEMTGSQRQNAGPNGEQIPHGKARHHVDHLRRRELQAYDGADQMISVRFGGHGGKLMVYDFSGFDGNSGENDCRFSGAVNVIPDRHHRVQTFRGNKRMQRLPESSLFG
nr:calmodulin-binding protein 25 [Ipomoea trifida]